MRSFRLVVLIAFIGALPLVGQARQLTDADYARAVKFLSQSTDPLVDHDVQRVKWLDATHFWYRDHDASGDHILEMDASAGKTAPAFDQAKLAAALGKARGKPMDAAKWPVRGFDFHVLPGGDLDVQLGDDWYRCDLSGVGVCTARDKMLKTGSEPGALSPNGKLLAFVRDWNLWVRDLATGKETQLTAMASRITATRRRTRAGCTATARSCAGRRTRRRSRRTGRTSVASA